MTEYNPESVGHEDIFSGSDKTIFEELDTLLQAIEDDNDAGDRAEASRKIEGLKNYDIALINEVQAIRRYVPPQPQTDPEQ